MLALGVLIFLLAVNAVLAMSEIAVVSSRKVRLQQAAEAGDKRSAAALELAENPTRFLSTVQIGITLIGIIAGAVGQSQISDDLERLLSGFPALAEYAPQISFVIVVLGITYFSLVLGELVPKRLGMNAPEPIARLIARPMRILSTVTGPVVWLLTVSTDMVLTLLGRRGMRKDQVTSEEITSLIEQGTQTGEFHQTEHELVERVFALGDQRVKEVMVPRTQIAWLDVDEPVEQIRRMLLESPYSHYPLCKGGPDRVVGVVHVRDVLERLLSGGAIDLSAVARKPVFVPEGAMALKVLESFKEQNTDIALVLDEYGTVEGLVTLSTLFNRIIGPVARQAADEDAMIVRREDGSWLLDGMLPVEQLLGLIEEERLPRQDVAEFKSVGGFVVTFLGRIPQVGEAFRWGERGKYRLEVMDMDRHRVDRVLLSVKKTATV